MDCREAARLTTSERRRHLQAVIDAGGRLQGAAAALGTSYTQLRGWMRAAGYAYGISNPTLRTALARRDLAALEGAPHARGFCSAACHEGRCPQEVPA